MEAKTHQELPPCPISPAPSPKEAPPALDEPPPAQTSSEPEVPEDTPLLHLFKKQETTAICGETDEEAVENVGEEIFQEQDKFVPSLEDVQALKKPMGSPFPKKRRGRPKGKHKQESSQGSSE
ncbi:proline-rich protein 12-like, partial [Sceloporus undulatus]|uniref:proline-rich protein 12-like n=1 Tax=Sceloporus undulatus TaxID=8520 RepID=UPI001C4C1A9B